MSGNTSETRKLGCGKCAAGIEHTTCEIYATPPEGEAATEQALFRHNHSAGSDFCPACPSEPSDFEGIPKGIANTVSGPEPPAPVVSTAAPEQPVNVQTKFDESESPTNPRELAVEIVDKCCGYTMESAPSQSHHRYLYDRIESHLQGIINQPAEGPDFGLDMQYVFDAVIAASEAIECTCQSKPDDAPCVSCKANHAAAIIETLRKRTAAATPVTVEAPTSDIARQIAICEENGTKWARFKVAEIKQLLATPKPIGDQIGIGECGELPLPEQSTAGMRLTGTCDGKPQINTPPLSNEHSPIVFQATKSKPIGDVEAVARQIIERVAKDAVMFAIVRNSLEWDEDLEQTDEEIAQDAVSVCTGDEMGCLDESNATAENCTHVFVREALSPFFAPAGPEKEFNAKNWLKQFVKDNPGTAWMLEADHLLPICQLIELIAQPAAPVPEGKSKGKLRKEIKYLKERIEVLEAELFVAKAPECLRTPNPAQPPCSECATLPAKWHEDSSLETWFPLTAEELKRTKAECATIRKERDEARAAVRYECEQKAIAIEQSLADSDRACASEAQLSTLRDLDVNGIAETIAHEVCDETPKMHGNLPCWPGTHIIAEKVKQHLRAALAPTPEVAKE